MTTRRPACSSPSKAIVRLPFAFLVLFSLVSAKPFESGRRELSSELAVLESIDLEDTATGADILIVTSSPVQWISTLATSGELVLRAPVATSLQAHPNLRPGTGIVASVEIATESSSPSMTRVRVETRQRAAYAVFSDGNRLRLSLRSAGSPIATSALRASRHSPALSAGSGDETLLGPGDVLEIDVFGLADFDRKVRILRDGTISLPLLGSIRVAGFSVQESEDLLAGMLADRQLVNDPQVSVFVEEFVSRTVSVQGAVERPGVYPLKGRSTLLDMIGAAGGLADKRGREILVLRSDEGQSQRTLQFDVDILVSGSDASLNIPLRAGDIVVVEQALQFRVYVTGAVVRPGAVEYSSGDGITALQAITAAGGLTERANPRNVHILRRTKDGLEERLRLNIKKIQSGKERDVPLQRNDTLVVAEWFV